MSLMIAFYGRSGINKITTPEATDNYGSDVAEEQHYICDFGTLDDVRSDITIQNSVSNGISILAYHLLHTKHIILI